MHCSECEALQPESVRLKLRRPPGAARQIGRLRLLYCERCGSPLAPLDATETLLSKLSQLTRFGLSAGDQPILSDGTTHGRQVALESE